MESIGWNQLSSSNHFDFSSRANSFSNSRKFLHSLWKWRIDNLQLSTNFEIKSCHIAPVHCLSLDKQEYRYLLCGGADGVVSLYDLESCQNQNINSINSARTSHILKSSSISSVQWYPTDTGLFTISTRGGGIQLWDTNLFKKVTAIIIPNVSVLSTCMNTNNLIAIGSTSPKVMLYDPISGDRSHVLLGHTETITSVDWNPTFPFQLASASQDGSLKLWDIRKGDHHGLLMSFDWKQDHNNILTSTTSTSSSSKTTSNLITKPMHIKQDLHSLQQMKKIDWSRDSLAKAHSKAIRCIKYTSCGRYIISSGDDKKIRTWNTITGKLEPISYDSGCVSELNYSFEIATFGNTSVSNDLLLFPNGNEGEITITPIHSNGKSIKTLKGHISMVNAIIFRQTFQQVISCGRDGMIYVWDCVNTNDIIHDVNSLEFAKQHNSNDCDNWSDDEIIINQQTNPKRKRRKKTDNNNNNSNEETIDNNSNELRFYIPPILQNYISKSNIK